MKGYKPEEAKAKAKASAKKRKKEKSKAPRLAVGFYVLKGFDFDVVLSFGAKSSDSRRFRLSLEAFFAARKWSTAFREDDEDDEEKADYDYGVDDE